MSSLFASRWAATPPAEESEATFGKPVESGLLASRWADVQPQTHERRKTESQVLTPPSDNSPPQAASKKAKDEGAERLLSSGEGRRSLQDNVPNEEEETFAEVEQDRDGAQSKDTTDQEANGVPDDGNNDESTTTPVRNVEPQVITTDKPAFIEDTIATPISPTKVRFEAQRARKKVSWRGKTCVISIPSLAFGALNLAIPLRPEEVQSRLRAFEEAGYNISGFDMAAEDGGSDDTICSRPIFPEEAESPIRTWPNEVKVALPDLARWRAYIDELTERKLAALGVSSGSEDPLASTSPSILKQLSTQYPPMPFSPPTPSGSAGSFNRPPFMRGHSHAASVASPISPMVGPMGHMHRHSTFTGPTNFQNFQASVQRTDFDGLQARLQQEQRVVGSPIAGMSSNSPFGQTSLPGFATAASPAQFAALRNGISAVRSPASPLGQPTQDYSRSLAEDQLARQKTYFNLVGQAAPPHTFTPNGVGMQPSPILPQLPEEQEEEEEEEEGEIVDETDEVPALPQSPQPDPAAYVPPHKRAELNASIAVPVPRGHRHNISEGLERDILESERRHEAEVQNYIEVEEESSGQTSQSEASGPQSMRAVEKDPLSQDYPVLESSHNHKKSASRLNVAAPAFKFNPGATFQPGATAFAFGASNPKTDRQEPTSPNLQRSSLGDSAGHNRQRSSGAFNVAAPEFKPNALPALPKSVFNFSSSGPTFGSSGLDTRSMQVAQPGELNQGSSIFGKVEIPDIVKPARRSKAIEIRRPNDIAHSESGSQSEVEDEEGRIAQSEDRFKRQRKFGGSGEEVPRFAEPTPMPVPPTAFVLKSQPPPVAEETTGSMDEGSHDGASDKSAEDREVADTAEDAFDREFDLQYGERGGPETEGVGHSHKHSTSLSALAKAFEPQSLRDKHLDEASATNDIVARREIEDVQIRDNVHRATSLSRSRDSSVASQDDNFPLSPRLPQLAEERLAIMSPPTKDIVDGEPSFAEIDAVMRQLNEAEDEQSAQEGASISPLPSPGSHPLPGVTYIPEWVRSDAPSPSPKRLRDPSYTHADSSLTIHDRTDSGERLDQGRPQDGRLNKAAEIPTSDWSADFSVRDDDKLRRRSSMLDSHIDDLIGRVLDKRLQPLEDTLRSIQTNVNRRPSSRDLMQKHSSSAVESDADDEDELSEEQRQRPISRGRDKRIDQIKIAMAEALREQSHSRRSQTPLDLHEIYSYLADMKASFARAASASLELDDIRGIVDDAVGRQSETLMPIAVDANERERTHRRQKSELEARLNQTLAGMLEEANLRRAAEEREAETRRLLQQTEDDMRELRDSARDDNAKITALERDRHDLASRLEEANDSQRDAEEQVKNLEAENAATYATLEEYRMSSSKWRQHIDQATREREELEYEVAEQKTKVEESEERRTQLQQDLDAAVTERGNLEMQLSSLKEQLEDSQESRTRSLYDIDRATKERADFENTIDGLERQLVESQESGTSMRRRLEKLHFDMANAAGQLASEKTAWKDKEAEYRTTCDTLHAEIAAHVKSRSQLEHELASLRGDAKELSEARVLLDQMSTSKSTLDGMVKNLQGEVAEQKSLAAQFERDFQDAKQSGRDEAQRLRASLEADVETANHRVNTVRAELEADVVRARGELETVRSEAENTKVRHARATQEAANDHREALDKINQLRDATLRESRQKHQTELERLRVDHKRALNHATEDKQRSESFLNERLALSDEKLQLFQDKILHLEERLDITKSAAQAAAMSAQSRAVAPAAAEMPAVPHEKVSPQALRESILVLQDQLQDREAVIEKLRNEADDDAPARLKSRDDEIAWLRELLTVRSEELTNLVNTLARPTFDRGAVRDTAIRIRANLQMEQQEKERSSGQQTAPEQAMASLSNFATPKAAQLTSAFNKWRANMESSALKNAPRGNTRPRSNTPAKSANTNAAPKGYMEGLMTPPASNLRATPSPEPTGSLPAPRLHSRPGSKASDLPVSGPPKMKSRQLSAASETPTTPLLRSQSYDQDAVDSKVYMQDYEESFDDDSLDDIADSQPPAFRSLETELEDADSEEVETLT